MAEVVKLNPKPRVESDARRNEEHGNAICAFPDRERQIEDERLELLHEWLEEADDWLLMLVVELAEGPFESQDHLSEWVQLNWHGSEVFSTAPLEGLRWQAANDLIFHSMEGEEYDLELLMPA
ncbi:hypothetical protein Sa4125_30350 [Aureimonas sp. SA4125]|uniref:hypothetical protein n=1 Tax=Aureimonas sp. SA4125 TaxID=2826993 RepID=UPI001CC3D573|nr:hypothetical protein [Aureimonas sp. SA4125]BDA85493.1 hypothetical protein Sa4125_30350 [Aureimonas sp. SA4125]